MAGKKEKQEKKASVEVPVGPPRLAIRYRNEIKPALRVRFGCVNDYSVPRMEKVVVNMCVGQSDDRKKRLDAAMKDLACATGQRPVKTIARQSVAGFRLREGMEIGCKVTLRGNRMYEFLDRLISIAIPRVRDFQGLNPKAFDQKGNFTLGIEDQTVFPEIDLDYLEFSQGMDICFVNTASNAEEGRALLESFGMPFAKS